MKCGDRGHLTETGQPCQQNISSKAAGCLWHTASPEGRKLISLRGNIASRMNRALPATYQVPDFTDEDSIVTFARELVRLALTEDVEPRRVDSAIRGASLALSALSAKTQAKLVDALLRVEHGGAAFAMLARLQDGLAEGKRRPLPPRVLSAVAAPSNEAES